MAHTEEEHGTRRDFLYVATGAAGAVATGAAVWPIVHQMNPSADVLALSTIQVDISEIPVGTQVKAFWQGKPVFIRHRTPENIAEAREVPMEELIDPFARNDNLPEEDPALDQNRCLDEQGEWLVMIGVCTHFGCIPVADQGDFGGWFCPCHGSHYDTAGRIRKGPAPENMAVPYAEFLSDNVIQLGKDEKS
ncbi:ubiquinol-cytochrome c reductase iron-sulfur subunit [Halovulum sp. GXIMD14793]